VRLADKLKASTIVLAPHPHEFLDSLYHQSVSPPRGPLPRVQRTQQAHEAHAGACACVSVLLARVRPRDVERAPGHPLSREQ